MASLTESFPSALEDSIGRLKLDKRQFEKIHAIVHTGTDNSAEAAAAALLIVTKDVNVVLQVVTKSFPEADWNLRSAIHDVLLKLLTSRLSNYAKLESFLRQILLHVERSHKAYQDFRQMFATAKLKVPYMKPLVPGVPDDLVTRTDRFVKLTWTLALFHHKHCQIQDILNSSDINVWSCAVAIAAVGQMSRHP